MHPVSGRGLKCIRVKIPYLSAQVKIITNVQLRAQLELETNLKKRKTRVFTCPTKLTCLALFVFIFYLFSKSPDPIKHPPKSFYFYEVLLHNILKGKLISKGMVFRQSSVKCLVHLILSLSKTTTLAVNIFFPFFNCSSTDFHFPNCTLTSIAHLPRLLEITGY